MHARACECTRAYLCEGSGTPTSIRYRRLERSKKRTALGVVSSRRRRISSARMAPSSRLYRKEIGQNERRTQHDSLFRVGCNSAVLQTHTRTLSLLPSFPLSHVSYRRLIHSPPSLFALRAGNVPTQWRLTDCTWEPFARLGPRADWLTGVKPRVDWPMLRLRRHEGLISFTVAALAFSLSYLGRSVGWSIARSLARQPWTGRHRPRSSRVARASPVLRRAWFS